jgi:hypothetical protein
MPSTYIDLTNALLRRLNEVEIEVADFADVRGVQALAKDAVRASIAKINAAEFEWPFNSAEHSQALTVGEEDYSWPNFFKSVEWNSFYIVNDGTNTNTTTSLDFVSRDYYYDRLRNADLDAGNSGLDLPKYVFPSHGNGYGVSPSPNKAYVLRFRYFLNYAELLNYDDQTRVPSTYDHVLIAGAMYHMYLFRDNSEMAGIAQQEFMAGIKEMQTLLLNKYASIEDTRVSY